MLYIDLHLVHEVTSPQAFAELDRRGLTVRRPQQTLATMDHSTPTDPSIGAARLRTLDPQGAAQLEQLERNCASTASRSSPWAIERRGIVHVIGPELGLTQPGMTIVCGDSHTSTHGAFGALAFGIGTSEVGHVLATQCLLQYRPKTFEVRIDGELGPGVTAKDLILDVIAELGVDGGTGHVFEYRGSAIRVARHGRAHDGLQHVDRGRRARRHDRARRDHVRLPRGPAQGAARRGLGARARDLAPAAHRRRRALRSHRSPSTPRRSSP